MSDNYIKSFLDDLKRYSVATTKPNNRPNPKTEIEMMQFQIEWLLAVNEELKEENKKLKNGRNS
jgi:hypothetical protein